MFTNVPSLEKLPAEVLMMICGQLESLDDYDAVKRVCRSIWVAVYQHPLVRNTIFKSIISTASHHKYDLETSRILSIRKHVNGKSFVYFNNTSNTLSYAGLHASLDESPARHNLTSKDVELIRGWWYKVKAIYRLYCTPGTLHTYRDCPNILVPLPESHKFSDMVKDLTYSNYKISHHSQSDVNLTDDKSFIRFYRAVAAHWRGHILYDIAHAVDPRNGRSVCLDKARAIFRQTLNKSLDDLVEILEAVEFVWGFLGYIIFGCDKSIREPDRRYSIMLHSFIDLQPPHFFELLQKPYDMSEQDKDEYVKTETSQVSITNRKSRQHHAAIEEGIVTRLTEYAKTSSSQSDTELRNECRQKWHIYKRRWGSDMKGRVFLGESPSGEKLYHKILIDG